MSTLNPLQSYDFVIIGSGFGGSVSAMRLTEKGYRVLVLERGKRFRDQDYPRTDWNIFKFLWAPALRCLASCRSAPSTMCLSCTAAVWAEAVWDMQACSCSRMIDSSKIPPGSIWRIGRRSCSLITIRPGRCWGYLLTHACGLQMPPSKRLPTRWAWVQRFTLRMWAYISAIPV